MKRTYRLVQNVNEARKALDALVYSFSRRYDIAQTQRTSDCVIDIKVGDLQKDLVATRKACAALLGHVAALENAIEDLLPDEN